MNKNLVQNLVLLSPTPYGTMRLWFDPSHKNAFIKLSIWGGIDARDPEFGTVSVEVPPTAVDELSMAFPGFNFTNDTHSYLALMRG